MMNVRWGLMRDQNVNPSGVKITQGMRIDVQRLKTVTDCARGIFEGLGKDG